MVRTLFRLTAASLLTCVVCGVAAPSAAAQDCTGAFAIGLGFSTPTNPVGAAGHTALIVITAPSTCSWSVVSNSPILILSQITSGSGDGEVPVTLTPNPGDVRIGSVTLHFATTLPPRDFGMVQRGCLSVLSRPDLRDVFPGYERRHAVDAGGGKRYLKVNPASIVCSWPASTNAPWITTTAGGFGEGPGFVGYSVEPNTSGESRQGTITVGYMQFTIIQSGRWADDLNGDSTADLLWHHQTEGYVAAWLMDGLDLVDGRLLDPGRVPDTAWKVVGSADFTEDGRPDIVWQHDDGRVAVWTMESTKQVRGLELIHRMFPADIDWRLRAVADLNSDGHPDLIFHHRTTGQLTVWLMFRMEHLFDAAIFPGAVGDTNWQVVGAADVNEDGQVDLLWQNLANGLISTWTLEWSTFAGWTVTSGTLLNPGQLADIDWRIRAVMDVDRDGHSDLIWQHRVNGLISAWLMEGTTLRDGILLSPSQVADTNWMIAGPR